MLFAPGRCLTTVYNIGQSSTWAYNDEVMYLVSRISIFIPQAFFYIYWSDVSVFSNCGWPVLYLDLILLGTCKFFLKQVFVAGINWILCGTCLFSQNIKCGAFFPEIFFVIWSLKFLSNYSCKWVKNTNWQLSDTKVNCLNIVLSFTGMVWS